MDPKHISISEKKIKSFDGTKIAFNHYRWSGRKSIIVIVHGVASSKDLKNFRYLSNDLFKSIDVMCIDQRGHGKSSGRFTFSAVEHKDIKAIIDYAKRIYKNIFLMGFSLGAASSVIQAAKYKNVSGVILVSPPTDFAKIENEFLRNLAMLSHSLGILPTLRKLGGKVLRVHIGNIFQKKEKPVDLISKIFPIPILIIHGKNDNIIKQWHSRALYKRAKYPKKLIILTKGQHAENLYVVNPKNFIKLLTNWIIKCKNKKCLDETHQF